jgi:hypothetical protein
MIHPDIWQSEDFSKLSTLAKLLFIGMFSLADDYGKGRAKPVYLKSVVFPYDDGMRIIDIEKALSEIGPNMSVTFYAHDGNDYYRLDSWDKWQNVDHPQPSKIADPQPFQNDSGIIPESFENESSVVKCSLVKYKGVKNHLHGAETAPCRNAESPTGDPVITITLNDKSEYPVYEEQVHEWAALYPAVDVIQQLREIRGWNISNPQKRKTKSGILRHITSWLAREQNKGGNVKRITNGSTPFPDPEPAGDYTDITERFANDFLEGDDAVGW